MTATSSISVPWFWRVSIWCLVDVDIPQLTSDGIYIGGYCFRYTYFLQSSSTHSSISSSFDATGLDNYINFGKLEPSATSTVVRNRREFNSIPLDVKDLWIRRFDTSDISAFTPNRFKSLKTLVIGNGTLWTVNGLYLNNLTCLEMLYIGEGCFHRATDITLTSIIVWLVSIHRSSSTTIHWFWSGVFLLCSIFLIGWYDWWIGLNSQIFLNYNQSN